MGGWSVCQTSRLHQVMLHWQGKGRQDTQAVGSLTLCQTNTEATSMSMT